MKMAAYIIWPTVLNGFIYPWKFGIDIIIKHVGVLQADTWNIQFWLAAILKMEMSVYIIWPTGCITVLNGFSDP